MNRERPDSGRIVTSGDVINDLHDEIAQLRGTRKVLWNLLGECLPVIDALMQIPGDDDSDAHLNGLAGRINDARTVVQAEELPGATPTSGAADLPEALRRSTAADGKTELFNLPGYPLMVRAVDFNRIHTESEMQKAALAAGQATAAKQPDSENLRKALQFYADSEHFIKADDTAWDTVSGEPQNYWCDEAGTATVEDGSIARLALSGQPVHFEDEWQSDIAAAAGGLTQTAIER